VQHVVSLSLYIDVLWLKLQMYFNLVLVEISQDCHVAVMLLRGVSTNWRFSWSFIVFYVNDYCLTTIADVLATYFVFFLLVGFVMSMCVQERYCQV
jgi:hypothetical protein